MRHARRPVRALHEVHMTASEIRSAGRFILRSPRTALSVIACIALGAAAVSAVAS